MARQVLRYGEQVLGQDRPEGPELVDVVHEVARTGIANYGADPRSWPSDVQGGENPSLMLGLAGVGHFYLRLYDPSIPSVLLLRREDFRPKAARESAPLAYRQN